MIARRQELNTQLQQIFDSFLLAISLYVAHSLRYLSTDWFNLEKTVDPLSNYHWVIIVVMAFGPILLDLQGFYQSPLTKTKVEVVHPDHAIDGLPEHRGQRLRHLFAAPAIESLRAAALHFDRHGGVAGQGTGAGGGDSPAGPAW
jgi:hypothetical protein